MAGFRRLRRFGGGHPVSEQALESEMRWHLERLAEELEEGGMTASEARREAERRFGDVDAYHRQCRSIDARGRAARSWRAWLDGLVSDVRSAVRSLGHQPAYAVTVVATLALAIGANTAMFSIVDSVVLTPPDLPEAHRVLVVHEAERDGGGWNAASPANFVDWRAQAASFSGLAAYHRVRPTLGHEDEPARLDGAAVSEDFFPVLGRAAALGRTFDDAEHSAPDARVVVLGDRLYRGRFAGDPTIVGSDIDLDGERYRVIGVMPPGVDVPLDTDLYLPLVFDFDVAGARGAHYLSVIGRLASGVDVPEAFAELDAIARRLEAEYPDTNTGAGIELVPLHEEQVGSVRPVLLTLLAAVAGVLLIACANVASLALVRAANREREMALRAVLGAHAGRLRRLTMIESLLLAIAGGVAGLLLARLTVGTLVANVPFDVPRLASVTVDSRVLLFTWAVTLVCSLLFGLAPAFRLGRVPFAGALRDAGARLVGIGRRLRLRQGLVVAELAMAMVLLSACGLLVRSLIQVTNVDLGFRTDRVLTFHLDLPDRRYPEDHHSVAFFETLLERLEAEPGVSSAAIVPWLPLRWGWYFSFDIVGRPSPPPGSDQGANLRMISSRYFETLRIPVHAGRDFRPGDDATAPLVVVVNQALVDRYFAGTAPIGESLVLGYGRDEQPERRIVGVVGNVRQHGPSRSAPPTVYVPHTQIPFSSMSVAVHTETGDPMALAPAVRGIVQSFDSGLAIDGLSTFESRYAEVLAARRFMPAMLGAFATVAVVLAALGLYGVLAQLVANRTAELGVRRALGATAGGIAWLVLGRALTLVVAGVAIGVAGSWASGRLLSALLFEVRPGDPVTLAAVSGALVGIASVACLQPIARAVRVDPAITLRDGS